MSFLFKSTSALPSNDGRLSNIRHERINTNEEARALPWFAGRARLGLTWITEALNTKADPVTQTYQAGKKKKKAVTGYIYSAQLGGLISHGPVDDLLEIWIDSVKVWTGPITRAASGLVAAIDITGQASLRLYWGNQTDADPILVDHPAYTGQCIVAFDPLIFGQDRTAAPNVEFVMTRQTVVPGMTNPTNEGDVCPIHAVIELLCHPRYGIGLRTSDFNLAQAQAMSDAVTAAGIWVSPLVTKATNALTVVADVLGYFDGYLRQGADGRYTFGSASIAVDHTATPIIDSAQQTDHAEIMSQSYALTPSETRLSFTDRERDMKEAVVVFSDTASLAIHGTSTPLQLAREWVTRQSIANKLVTKAGLRAALPAVEINVPALFSACSEILPGDGVRVRPWHGAGFYLKCRLKRRQLARSTDREVNLSLVLDPAELAVGDAPEDYTPPEPVLAEPVDLVEPLLRVLPEAFAGGGDGDAAVLLIGARAHALTTGYDVWFSRDDTTYELLSNLERFAGTGVLVDADWDSLGDFVADDATDVITLVAHGLAEDTPVRLVEDAGVLPAPLVEGVTYYAINVTADTFHLSATAGGAAIDLTDAGTADATRAVEVQRVGDAATTLSFDMHPVDRLAFTTQTAAQADENRLLLFVGDEILSVEGYVAAGGTTMQLTNLRRGRFGTVATPHLAGARAWLIYLADVVPLTHVSFELGETRYLKPVTFTIFAEQDIAAIDALQLDI